MGETSADWWMTLYGLELMVALCAGLVLVVMALFGRVSYGGLKMWLPAIMAASAILVPVLTLFALLFWVGLQW